MDAHQGDVGGFHRAVGGADARCHAPGFDDPRRLSLLDHVEAADRRQYAGVNVGQHQAVHQHLPGARRAGGDCLLHGADVAAEHQQEFPGTKGSAEQELYVRAFQHDVAQLHSPGDTGQF